MKKMLFSAALVGLSLTLFSPAASFAGDYASKRFNSGNSTNHVKNNHEESCCRPCPPKNHQVPEPGTLALLGAAAGAIYLKKRKNTEE